MNMKKEADRFLSFSLCGERYAVPLLKVREVIAPTDLTPVPYAPAYFKGIMNLRGQVISVIDLCAKFRMPGHAHSAEAAIVILDLESLCLGVRVDSVDSVLAVSPDELSPPPDIDDRGAGRCIAGVIRKEDQLVLLLDPEKTFSADDLRSARQNHKESA